MLYVLSTKRARLNKMIPDKLEKQYGIITINSESHIAIEILAQKRVFNIIEIDAKDLHKRQSVLCSATLITPDNSRLRIKLKDMQNLVDILDYKPKTKYQKFIEKLVRMMTYEKESKEIY